MYKRVKKKVYGLLNPDAVGDIYWDKVINAFIIILILLNVTAVMLQTVDAIHQEHAQFFYYFDIISVCFFTVEYLLRLWSINQTGKYAKGPWGRLRYIISVPAIIDLIAILPFLLYLFFNFGFDLREVFMLRLFRVLRIFRLTSYTSSVNIIVNVFKKRKNELILSFIMTIMLVILASCVIYFAEHRHPISKLKFSSIPATLWWAVVTLTTTGYGDMYPITSVGKLLSGFIMLISVAFFAIPAGILSAGFLEEFRKTKVMKSHKCPHCGELVEFEEDRHAHHSPPKP